MPETETDDVVGIDVGKTRLDVAVLPSGTQWTVANTAAGVRQLVERLQVVAPGLTVLEATGGYERALVTALAAAARPLVVANPRQVRAFARAIGQLAKTDRLDAPSWRASASRSGPRRGPCRTRRRRRSTRS